MPVPPAQRAAKKKAPKKRKPQKSDVSSTSQPDNDLENGSTLTEESREILYPVVEAGIGMGPTALTADRARELLGWRLESSGLKFNTYLLKDAHGVKIRCLNNTANRSLDMGNVKDLVQEILRKRWRFNGEPIIIGKTGQILNGQHQLVALVLAAQEWELHPGKWIEWQEEPTIDKLVIKGVDEGDDTVNTMDTCKPRTLDDVIFRSAFFSDVDASERRKVSRICSYAVKTLWDRMGAAHAFAPRRNHSEALEFLAKHPRILDAVHHISVENVEGSIGKYLSPGYAAGMFYLMGCSTTEPKDYILNPTEESLDFSNWDKAREFFQALGNDQPVVSSLKKALGQLIESEEGGTRIERLALVSKAWLQYARKGNVGTISLKYLTDPETGLRTLEETPSVGGIDLVQFRREELEEDEE